MLAYFAQIKFVHILCVILSGSVFTLRGLMMLAGSEQVYHPLLRRTSYLIDTTLLAAGVTLAWMLHQYPFVHAWLTVKVVLLAVYIVLGVFALRRGRSRATRAGFYLAALAVFLFIVSVAITHDPWGVFAIL
ncbi:MAG: SirB2 family protein [Rudaea sp.]